ncbi:MAG TPA: polysaccharide deacetylase family protein, partial [Acetobacteraceae bacterium]|nr:polysaccharide deacetylase family protein [Acetobacteraceae bacterium]
CPMNGLRPLLRKVAYRSGLLGAARLRLRSTLTVLMLHRVMDPADQDFALADPTFTMSSPLFASLLEFLRDHYEIVSLADVMAAYDGVKPLPHHSLLITFDDGWADNLRYAAPLLQRGRIPAVVFAVAAAVLSRADVWWQERLFIAARNGSLTDWLGKPQVKDKIADSARGRANSSPIDVATILGLMEDGERDELLLTLPSTPCSRRMMLEPGNLRELVDHGIDIGLHGYSHVPLTNVPDVTAELSRANHAIHEMSGGRSIGTALGCPHGQYDSRVVDGAHAVGIKLVFTSDPCLNATHDGMLTRGKVLGRINVIARHMEDRPGRFDPSAAARFLWAREVR